MIKMKKTIVCIAGMSGSGKSEVADHIASVHGYKLIQSYTTRPKRDAQDTGHTFIDDVHMDQLLAREDVLARTQFGDYRYCCLESDLKKKNVYVISEDGIDELKEKFGTKYNIFTVFIERSRESRAKSVGEERVARDEGNYYKEMSEYDMVLDSNCELSKLLLQSDILIAMVEKTFPERKHQYNLCHVGDSDCESCQ